MLIKLMIIAILTGSAAAAYLLLILVRMSRPTPVPARHVRGAETFDESGYVGRHRYGFKALPVEYASGIDYRTYVPTPVGVIALNLAA